MGSFVFLDADNVGNDLARLFNNHTVAHTYVLTLYFLGIVEACTADRCSRKLDGFQLGNRCDGTRLTHLDVDGIEPSGGLVFFPFVGDQPARAF